MPQVHGYLLQDPLFSNLAVLAAMSDKPLREIDSVSEKSQLSPGVAVLAGPSDHGVLHAERERQDSAFHNLKDDFGKNWFTSAQLLLHSGHESHGQRDESHGRRDELQGHPDKSHGHADESRVHRIEQAGQRKGAADIAAVASLRSISSASTLPELLQACDRVQKIAAIGESRADRLAYFLDKRHGTVSQESEIKNQIEAVKAEKLGGVVRLQEQEARKKDEKSAEKGLNKNESKIEKLIQFKMVSDKEWRDHAHDISKDFASWASARETVGLLGNKEKAVGAMDDLVHKARDGNPAARDALAATLVSGNAADSWLIAKRGDFNGVQRPIAIPNLPPELSTDLKLQAAKGLISIGEHAALTRSEQMALAMVMGEAFNNRLNGDKSAANNQLLTLTVKHFVKTLSADPHAARSEKERDATVGRLTRAMGGMVEAVRNNVRGAACLREFINQVMVADEKTVRISPFVKQSGMFGRTKDGRNVFDSQSIPGGRQTGDLTARKPPAAERSTGRAAETAFRSILEMMKGKGRRREQGDSMRTTFRIGERTDFLELESGRYYDAVLRRFFVREGDLLVEDSKPGTDRERCEIALANSNPDKAVFIQAPVSGQNAVGASACTTVTGQPHVASAGSSLKQQ